MMYRRWLASRPSFEGENYSMEQRGISTVYHLMVLENTDATCEDFKVAIDNLNQEETHLLNAPEEKHI